jgi:hypothetical protein
MDDDDQVNNDDATMVAGGEDFVEEDAVQACLARCSDDVTLAHSQEHLDWHTSSISDSEAQVRCHFCPLLCTQTLSTMGEPEKREKNTKQ